jgi:hypothetical protein
MGKNPGYCNGVFPSSTFIRKVRVNKTSVIRFAIA